MKQKLKVLVKKYLKTLFIIPIFLFSLVVSFFIILKIPPEVWGCQGFGCFGIILLLPYLTVAIAIPLTIALYLLIIDNSKLLNRLHTSIKTFILKPFPKKRIIITIATIPTILILLILVTSTRTGNGEKYQTTRPSSTTTSKQNTTTRPTENPPNPTPNSDQEEVNWQRYTSQIMGFNINYPENFYIHENLNTNDPIVKISNSKNFENDEAAIIISIQETNKTDFSPSDNKELLKVMDKIGYQQLSEDFAYHTSYNFIGDPPWGYYQISIPSTQTDIPSLLLTVRLHRQDDMQISEGGTQGAKAELVNQILSTFKFTN